MSLLNIHQAIARLGAEVAALKARVNLISQPQGIRIIDPIGVLPVHTHQGTGGGGQLDHGAALTGLTDDDHTQYLKEEASGGVASEVPDHTHSGTAEAGGPLSAANTHASPAEDTHHAKLHGAADHTDRTSMIFPLVRVIGTYATDSLGDSHLEQPNGSTTYLYFEGYVPADFVAGSITFVVRILQHAAGTGNVVWEFAASATRSGGSGSVRGVITQTVAVSGVLNSVQTDLTQVSSSNPQAGDRISFRFNRLGEDAADTYAGVMGVLGAYCLYTRDE